MIAYIFTTHDSTKRPNGHGYLEEAIESLQDYVSQGDQLIIVDNASQVSFNYQKYGCHFIHRNPQDNGLTGAWNIGTSYAYQLGADLICLMNDDLVFNDTFRFLYDRIMVVDYKDYTVFGVVSDAPNTYPNQLREEPDPIGTVIDVTGEQFPVHGWLMAFTNKFYEVFQRNGALFDRKYPFGKNENHFQQRVWGLGGKSKIIADILVHHHHLGSWKK